MYGVTYTNDRFHLHPEQERYEQSRLREHMFAQGRVILAIDGLQPHVEHFVPLVIREVLSGEILLARPLLSSSQEDLAMLLKEVKEYASEGEWLRDLF